MRPPLHPASCRRTGLRVAGGLLALVSGSAVAGEPSLAGAGDAARERPFFVRLGAGFVDYRTTGNATSGGARIDNPLVAFGRHGAGTIEGGWRFSPYWSASVLSGLPPTVSLYGRGAFAELGELRKVTYGSVMPGVQFHPLGRGRIDPYVGGGLDYTFIFGTRGGSMSELRVADTAGPILQAGVDIRLTERLSFYADVRKIWLSFNGKGVAQTAGGPLPVRVEVHPNPLLATFGLSYRF